MQDKTKTTLGELRNGDSFTYLNKKDVWRKIDSNHKWVMVNQVNATTKQLIHVQHQLKRKDTDVVFLRHTVPVPGEICFVEDLKEGDIFKSIEHNQEFIVTKPAYPFYTVVNNNGQEAKAGNLLQVIFIKHV